MKFIQFLVLILILNPISTYFKKAHKKMKHNSRNRNRKSHKKTNNIDLNDKLQTLNVIQDKFGHFNFQNESDLNNMKVNNNSSIYYDPTINQSIQTMKQKKQQVFVVPVDYKEDVRRNKQKQMMMEMLKRMNQQSKKNNKVYYDPSVNYVVISDNHIPMDRLETNHTLQKQNDYQQQTQKQQIMKVLNKKRKK